MLFLWFLVLTICVVNCEYVSDSYILEMPDSDVLKHSNKYPFKVYWNVPTKQCRYQKNSIPFDDVLRKYGISYNKNDKFEGETITIIYNVGYMPAILSRDGNKYSIRNGGLPQAGDLELHLTAFRETVMRLIPDPDFKGVGVIDMENWRPIFRQHWGKLTSIIDLSLSIEKRQFWWWPTSWLKMEATKRFEDAARIFMEKTLSTAKQMRPKALWGYYGFPYCFNMAKDMQEHCSKTVKEENDRTYWLWAESTALYPSLYSPSQFSTSELEALVRGRLVEANRVKRAGALVLPYFWLKYRDEKFFREKDLKAVFETLQKKNASGVIIWGSSNDVNQFGKCKELYDYIIDSFGPIARKYIKRINMLHDTKIKANSKNVIIPNSALNNTITVVTTTHITISNNTRENINNNLINTKKSDNISYNIIEQDQLSQYIYKSDNNYTVLNSSTESSIWDIISYGTDSINQTTPYFVPSITSQTISIKTTSFNNDSLIIAKIFSDNESNHGFNNKSDNVLKIIENSTSSNVIINNNTGKVILNDLTKLAVNLTNPLKTSDIYNLTEITTEMDSKSVRTIIPEKQLNKYFYEMDDNKTVISNESDIWTIIQYQTNVEEDEDSENLQSSKENQTESYYVHPSMTNIINSENIPYLENTNNKIENILIVTEADTVSPWLKTKNNSEVLHNFDEKRKMTNDSFEKIEETLVENNNILNVNYIDISDRRENNISDYLITVKVNFINTENTSEFATPQNIITPNMRGIDISDHLIALAVKPSIKSTISIENDILHESVSSTENSTSPVTRLISGNYTDENNILDVNSAASVNTSAIENYSLQNVNQEEQVIKNTTIQNIETPDSSNSRKNDISDYFMTAEANFINTENTPEFPTSPNIETPDMREIDISDYLIAVAVKPSPVKSISIENDTSYGSVSSTENSTSPVTRLISGNFTDENNILDVNSAASVNTSAIENYSLQNVNQEEQVIKNTTIQITETPDSSNSRKNDISDYFMTAEANFINIENTPEFLTSPNIETPDMREINISDYLIAVAVKPSPVKSISIENDTSYGSVSSTKNSTSPVTRLISGNYTDENNILDVNSAASVNTSAIENYSSQNVNQEEQVIKNTTIQNTETPDSSNSRENDISDYLITKEANFINTENTPEFPTSPNIETPDMREIDIPDYLIAVTVKPSPVKSISIENDTSYGSVSSTGNSINPETRLINDNDTDIIYNVKAANSLESMLTLPNNFSKDTSLDVKEDEQLFKNTTYPNVVT